MPLPANGLLDAILVSSHDRHPFLAPFISLALRYVVNAR